MCWIVGWSRRKRSAQNYPHFPSENTLRVQNASRQTSLPCHANQPRFIITSGIPHHNQSLKMSEATPRITAPYLEQFSHRTVRILGKVRQIRGEMATIEAGGKIDLHLNKVDYFASMNRSRSTTDKLTTGLSPPKQPRLRVHRQSPTRSECPRPRLYRSRSRRQHRFVSSHNIFTVKALES